jgi:hypothetical protein
MSAIRNKTTLVVLFALKNILYNYMDSTVGLHVERQAQTGSVWTQSFHENICS